jgi:hypothetical protein
MKLSQSLVSGALTFLLVCTATYAPKAFAQACEYPIANLDNCSGRTPRADHMASANGCGPASMGGALIPQGSAAASFVGPCNDHDICYETCNRDKAACDAAILEGMIASCRRAYPYPTGNSEDESWGSRGTCLKRAELYGLLVRKQGQAAYDAAQKIACECCAQWKGSLHWTLSGRADWEEVSGIERFINKRERVGSGRIDFLASPAPFVINIKTLPAILATTKDSYIQTDTKIRTEPTCTFKEVSVSTETGGTTFLPPLGALSVFIEVNETSYLIQFSSIVIPTQINNVNSSYEICAPDTKETLLLSTSTPSMGALGFVISNSFTRPLDSVNPKHFVGSAPLKQGTQPEVSVELDWDFLRP